MASCDTVTVIIYCYFLLHHHYELPLKGCVASSIFKLVSMSNEFFTGDSSKLFEELL